jgi:hypothetical protein
MATSNNALKVADLDFFSIRENLKDYLRNQATFQDYDFEGSGMSVLLDILAYNTYYNAFYLNMAANESFLDTAQIRNNVLSHAKLVNYVPMSKRGAMAKINVVVTPGPNEDQDAQFITLDKWTNFLGADKDQVNYPFVAVNSNTAVKTNGSFTFSNVVIRQGEVVTRQFPVTANNTARRFQIPSSNVDTSTLIVSVQESNSNTQITQYTLAGDFVDLKANSTVYFVEEDHSLNYSIYFGDDVIGKRPANGNIVQVTYLDTVGTKANNIVKFAPTDGDGIAGYKNNVRITLVEASINGAEKETVDQIKFRAPNYYVAQNRAVTKMDYETILTKNYPNIEAVSVWGGEENDPPVYGRVFMSLKTTGYFTLTNVEKEEIRNTVIRNRNVLTVDPEIVDPDFIFLLIRGKVRYNPNLTTRSQGQINNIIKEAIYDYAVTELYTFKSTFKLSKLQSYIEQAEPSITSSDIDIFMQKRQKIEIGDRNNYVLNYNTPLRKGDYNFKLYSYPTLGINDITNVRRDVLLEETPESFTGIDSIEIVAPGINYSSGSKLTITGDGTGAEAVATIVNGRIVKIEVTNPGINYTRAFVTINDADGSGAVLTVRLRSTLGTLRAYYFKSNGEKVFVNENAGNINYATGRVTLNSLLVQSMPSNDFYDQDVLTVNVVPEQGVIEPLRNRILAIDTNNIQAIQLELIPETS